MPDLFGTFDLADKTAGVISAGFGVGSLILAIASHVLLKRAGHYRPTVEGTRRGRHRLATWRPIAVAVGSAVLLCLAAVFSFAHFALRPEQPPPAGAQVQTTPTAESSSAPTSAHPVPHPSVTSDTPRPTPTPDRSATSVLHDQPAKKPTPGPSTSLSSPAAPGACYWKVEWKTAGLYADPWDETSFRNLKIGHISHGACTTVIGQARGSSGGSEQYVRLFADAVIPGGYVRENAVVHSAAPA